MLQRNVFKLCSIAESKIGTRWISQTCRHHNKEKWDLYAGVLIERLPVVSKTLTPLEMEFKEYLAQVDFENSLKSNYELMHEKDLLYAELIKKGKMEIDLDESSSKQTAQDLKDGYKEELKKFQLASCITKDDTDNNLKSVSRKLEDTLYLFVKQKSTDKSFWTLPQGKRLDGETMRQTAERIVKECCGNNLQVIFYGNAPIGFYKFKYPKGKGAESVGAKVFFYRSTLKRGNVDEKVTKNFEWLDADNINTKLTGSYGNSIQKLLL